MIRSKLKKIKIIYIVYKILSFPWRLISIPKYGKTFILIKHKDKNIKILDIGCGNNSAYHIKNFIPKSHYTGIDIENHNNDLPNIADKIIITSPKNFANSILTAGNNYDLVICNHNLEHCLDRFSVINNIIKVTKVGGEIYIAFPSEKTLDFPSRPNPGGLNYNDDKTHQNPPPQYKLILDILLKNNFSIIFSNKNFRPLIQAIIGFIIDPYMILKKRSNYYTWCYYGFESIIYAKKNPN